MAASAKIAGAVVAALVPLSLALPATATAQERAAEAPDPACVSRPDCRFVGPVTLRTDHGVVTPALNRNMPFLRTNNGGQRLWLVIGERVEFRLGGPGELPLIILGHGLASDPEKSKAELTDKIEVDFAQLPNSTYTVMTVHNGLGRSLQYKAFMLTRSGEEKPTSACAVLPGISSFESWPGPLLEIELADFQLTDIQQNTAGSMTVSCK